MALPVASAAVGRTAVVRWSFLRQPPVVGVGGRVRGTRRTLVDDCWLLSSTTRPSVSSGILSQQCCPLEENVLTWEPDDLREYGFCLASSATAVLTSTWRCCFHGRVAGKVSRRRRCPSGIYSTHANRWDLHVRARRGWTIQDARRQYHRRMQSRRTLV